MAAGLAAAVSGRAAEPLAPLLGCRALDDAAARLACFDRESAKLSRDAAQPSRDAAQPSRDPAQLSRDPAQLSRDPSQQPLSAPATADSAPPTPRRPVDALQSFGLPEGQIAAQEVAAGARPAELSKIDAHLSAISVTVTGQATFKLDNGQVWRQLLAEGDLLAKPGDLVSISVGVFHSYWLQVKSGRGCKVRRVL